jgi:hypothetical protein
VRVQEVQVLAPDRLEFPQRHDPDHLGNLTDKPHPSGTVVLGGGQRIAQFHPCLPDHIQNGGLSSRVLLKYSRVCGCRIRHRVPPVVSDELLRDGVGRYNQLRVGIVTLFDAQVRKGE